MEKKQPSQQEMPCPSGNKISLFSHSKGTVLSKAGGCLGWDVTLFMVYNVVERKTVHNNYPVTKPIMCVLLDNENLVATVGRGI